MMAEHLASNNRRPRWNVAVVERNGDDNYAVATILHILKRESVRCVTFENWPYENVVSGASLAEAGFFRIFERDRVQCAFCLGILGQWVAGDDAMGEHRRCFAACPFVRGVPVGNVRLGEDDSSLSPALQPTSAQLMGGFDANRYAQQRSIELRPRSGDFYGAGITSRHVTVLPGNNLSELGITPHCTPLEPAFATPESRVSTFRSWPPDKLPKPLDLAEAGWYFSGSASSDTTQCFHCGGSLHSWESDDDPWVEHAKWFPHCRHVLLVMGKAFVDGVQKNLAQKEKPELPKEEKRDVGDKEVPEDMLCKICLTNKVSLVFLPCSHLCACIKCASSLEKCPICRDSFKGYIRVFY